MHLILDIGNTNVKLQLFENSQNIHSAVVDSIDKVAPSILKDYPRLSKVIFADVRGLVTIKKLQALFPNKLVYSVKNIQLPFHSLYTTPNTMGDDRIALVAAAVIKYPQQNCLIIDAGTCLTFDFISSAAQYHGGAISPGMAIRFKSLQHFTGKLPLVQPSTPSMLYGDSTENAINVGVHHGIIYEIEGQINAYKKKYTSLTVILTGGDALHLSKSVKNTIFAEPNFLAEGLDYLLDYNKS